MNNQNFIKGVFIMAFALLFGLASLRYPVGTFSRGGPGLFPLMASSVLFVIGVITTITAFFIKPIPMSHSIKNISIIMLSLVGCAVISGLINMIAGIIFLVFCSSLAATSYSTLRNVKICVGLIAVAFGFKTLLGLNLPLL
ncbi:tripartite tricarboxylate transporter TctB family protein [Achromobacter seleniivolatilans]|uniref:Tripartite tricarboxylate transporter TctB family protein n=1 Tax=Achromobacter seleniivolatilans TaxID=3047478 RepID=A0ABY9M9J8_9BURK|nr:tripartite tricarboxylate transporter TctB family protein [Achromobacter sp. R39]WMD23686.1 tripartite tricarboxylate transporter TctB family protein [Achromobacter sp. R39]